MMLKNFQTASQLDGVIDLERLHSGPSDSIERDVSQFSPVAHNRPQGPSASQSVYRHGGLSIMEMLTPWLVLGPVGSI